LSSREREHGPFLAGKCKHRVATAASDDENPFVRRT
jgi:hypothetical protein